MTLHLVMAAIIIISGMIIAKSYTYINMLAINLALASDPQIQTKVKDPATSTAFQLATYEYRIWKSLWFPQTWLLTINMIWIWYGLATESIADQAYLTFIAIWGATLFTKILTTNIFPRWLYHWHILLHIAVEEVNLEYMETRLQEIRSQLQAVINGKQIPPQELAQLKYEGLFLSKQTEQYKKNK